MSKFRCRTSWLSGTRLVESHQIPSVYSKARWVAARGKGPSFVSASRRRAVTARLYSSSVVASWRRMTTPAIFRPTSFKYMSSGEKAEGFSEKRVDAHPYQVVISCQIDARSEEHTSELQSRGHLVCRLL